MVPRAIIVMGVSGTGKSTLGRALAERIGHAFIEGDECHPPSNIRKMTASIPLQDEDRWPWLAQVAVLLGDAAKTQGGVVACSALKRGYRDFLRLRLDRPTALIYPVMAKAELERRLARRSGHYMPANLLESQFAALQCPEPDEAALTIAADMPVAEQIECILSAWKNPNRQRWEARSNLA